MSSVSFDVLKISYWQSCLEKKERKKGRKEGRKEKKGKEPISPYGEQPKGKRKKLARGQGVVVSHIGFGPGHFVTV